MSHKIIGINLFKFVLLFIIIKRTSGFMLHNVTKLSRERRGEADYYDDTLHCSNYQCQCKSNYTAISVAQCVQTHLLSSCNDVTKCSDSWHSFCSKERKCVCTLANIAVGTSMCLPILNGYCWKDDQCQVENSVCIDFLCKCKQSFIAIAANLCLPIN
ncbi:uncharacterized protein LOC103574744 [Microplitis demolitor]|uniref:uncharacterized protein LOC103574744 n=1 Tax=Microplitis demolitor TaxID=69319 RepID=UPI0004CD76CC|nr:uncharacterized protein LOC103574744 [Microplitis demolitor]